MKKGKKQYDKIVFGLLCIGSNGVGSWGKKSLKIKQEGIDY